jgi:hypothetical protein
MAGISFPASKSPNPMNTTHRPDCNKTHQSSELIPPSFAKQKTPRMEDLTPIWRARSSYRLNLGITKNLFLLFFGQLWVTIKDFWIYAKMSAIGRLKNLAPALAWKRLRGLD